MDIDRRNITRTTVDLEQKGWRENRSLLNAWVPVATGLALMFSFAGCDKNVWQGELERNAGAGLALTFDIFDDTDVAGMEYTIIPVDCMTGMPFDPSTPVVVTEDLEDMLIPGGNGTFENAPFDANSGHLFSDHFFWLDEGCYDVAAQPIDENGEPSSDCASAHQDNVPVFDGQTTGILLISQCRGEGALDVIVALNHPPAIANVEYDPSKFICEDATKICVTVFEVDNDPITGVFEVDATIATIVSTTSSMTAKVETQSCATILVHAPGTANVNFTVYDMGTNTEGDVVTIEELLLDQGDPNASHDALTFPVHLLSEKDCIGSCECPEGFEPTPAGEECVRSEVRPTELNGELLTVCKALTNANYGKLGGQYPEGTVETSSFYGESYNDLDSRLNSVGVWACGSEVSDIGETLPASSPTGEWIGFSACLEIEEGADYLVGIAADNQMRFSLNGNLLYNYNTNAVQNSTYWWMNPVALNSGANIIALEGYNQAQLQHLAQKSMGLSLRVPSRAMRQ
ncbi:MAG: hypothetical protein GY822_32045 [Deltaproteobacteria bacterium]|nr:hypothetical protein [Deltaproteobacteria bacterium]